MNWLSIFFQAFGGLGLFLMGMKIMSESMQKIAGERLRKILGFFTSNRFSALLVGVVVTAIIQSSSATTVMTVGFVNATLMNLTQAIGIILGANIGTTVTGWIVTLEIVKYSMPLIGSGVLLIFFSKREYWRYLGEILFGFGILFLGMTTMKNGFTPLRNSEDFINIFRMVDGSSYLSVLLGVFIGTAATVIIQSSSASMSIAIALAAGGLLNFEGAVSIIIGSNIGTTITALLASIGASRTAKQTAIAHTLFNVLGAVWVLIIFYPFIGFIDKITPHDADFVVRTLSDSKQFSAAIGTKPYIGQHIAMAHTIFNVINVVVFLPFVNQLAKICEKIIPDTPAYGAENFAFKHLNYSLIETPQLAIVEAENELYVMSKYAKEGLGLLKNLLNMHGNDYNSASDELMKHEKQIDDYQKQISTFLLNLSAQNLTEEDTYSVGNYLTMAHNLEKVGDFTENIVKALNKMKKNHIAASECAITDLEKIIDEEIIFFEKISSAFKQDKATKSFVEESYKNSRAIKKFVKEAKIHHFERLQEDLCNMDAGFYFIDILNNLRSMSSELFNIAESAAGIKFD